MIKNENDVKYAKQKLLKLMSNDELLKLHSLLKNEGQDAADEYSWGLYLKYKSIIWEN